MDLPGFHLDGSAFAALFSLLNTLVLLYSARQVASTHAAVNGMQAAKVAEAHQAGVAEVVATLPPAQPSP